VSVVLLLQPFSAGGTSSNHDGHQRPQLRSAAPQHLPRRAALGIDPDECLREVSVDLPLGQGGTKGRRRAKTREERGGYRDEPTDES